MSSNCESCTCLRTRMSERMVHTKRLTRDLHLAQENLSKLSTTCANLQFENETLEKKVKRLEEKLQSHSSKVSEREILLEIINKDRDECLKEKMEVARFYRTALKEAEEENEELRRKYEFLKKNRMNTEDEEDPLEKIGNAISEDRSRNVRFLNKLAVTSRHTESIIKKVADLDLLIQTSKRIPSGSAEGDLINCYCEEVHETLDDIFVCVEKKKSCDLKEIARISKLEKQEEADDEWDSSRIFD